MTVRRMLDDSPDDFERALLESAQGDLPPSDAKRRAAIALGIVASASAAPAVAKAATSATIKSATLAKIALGITGLTVVGASIALWPRAVTPSAIPSLPEAADRTVAAPLEQARPEPTPVVALPDAPVVVVPITAPPRRRVRAVAPQPEAAPIGPTSLDAELALVDRARAANTRGDHRSALTLLDEHERTFATPVLAPEAEALRIEALDGSGAHAEARSRAQRFLAAHPSSPVARRIRAIADSVINVPSSAH